MSFLTRLMPIISWGIKQLLRLGVRMTIFGPMMLLTVRGRKTGKPRTVPVDLHERNGRRFLIATHGEGNWVSNLRASGEGILSLGWSHQAFTAVELTPEAAGAVIKEVLGPLLASHGLRGAALRQNIGVRADASLNDFITAARSHPVFELGSPDTPSSQSEAL
jgi:deazaflavin-dependent oxidoreductase (nitroreductase family)